MMAGREIFIGPFKDGATIEPSGLGLRVTPNDDGGQAFVITPGPDESVTVRTEAKDPVILQPAIPPVTLDDALLSMSTFLNGCDFRLCFEGRRTFLEFGCYGVHVNLVQGPTRLLMAWLQEGAGRRELLGIRLETFVAIQSRKPCSCCGGHLFKVDPDS